MRSQTNERSVWKEAVVLRRMGNPDETLKFGIERVDKGQISCQYKMQTADCRLGLKCRLGTRCSLQGGFKMQTEA